MDYNIKITKSLARFIFFSATTIIMALIIVALFVGLHNGTVENTLNDFWYFFIASLGAVIIFPFFANRSYGNLTVKGSVMTERKGLWSGTQSIDLSQVTRIQVVAGQPPSNSTYDKLAMEASLYFVLTAENGAVFKLDPAPYNRYARAKLAPVLDGLMHEEAIKKEGDIERALAIWSDTNEPSAKGATPKVSQLTATGMPRTRQTRAIKVFLLVFGAAIFILLSIIGIVRANYAAMCDSLVKNHTSTTAQVTHLQLLQQQKGRFRFDTPVADPAEATQIAIDIQYTANDEVKTTTLYINYTDKTKFTEVYNEAATGNLEVIYNPSQPSQVRPALEFADGTATLCKS